MRYGTILFSLLFLFSCSSDDSNGLEPLNLLQYGVPIIIMAPDSATVKTVDMGIVKDISIQGEGNYSVQLFAARALSTDIAKIKSDQIAEVKNNPFFSKIIKEEDQGFIFENAIDSLRTNYGFRYISITGDQELIMQNSLLGIFTLEEAEKMYKAVHPQAL